MSQPIWTMPAFVDVDAIEDDVEEVKNPRWYNKICNRLENWIEILFDYLPLKHIGPIIILVLYTVFGGWMFRHLELSAAQVQPLVTNLSGSIPAEIQHAFGENTTTFTTGPADLAEPGLEASSNVSELWLARMEMQEKILHISSDPTLTAQQKTRKMTDIWAWYDKKVADGCKNEEESLDEKWNMWNSMFYAATLYTTIGYGHIAPSTTGGRIATMVYALVGIPLVLTILNTWGDLLFNTLKSLMRLYAKCKNRKSAWVTMADLPEGIDDLPVSIAVFLLIFWIAGCAALFLIWEKDWNYFTSLYFFFISLTTIGLGDVVPKYPQYTLMSFILVLCGLSVVSMSFNIIQTKIESVFRSMMLGIEREYWQKQVEPEYSQLGEGGGGVNASVGVMQLWKKKPLRERILFRLMDKSKKEMLKEYWEKKANTKNQATQTPVRSMVDSVLQVDMEEEELQTKYKNRKYVYNLHD